MRQRSGRKWGGAGKILTRFVTVMAALSAVSVAVLLSPPMAAPAHAGVMDYLFNAIKDLTTPVEPVTPAEETKTPITHPADAAPEPARTLVFDIRDAQTGEAIPEAKGLYHYYDMEGAEARGSVEFKDKGEFALPAGSIMGSISIWAEGCAAKSCALELHGKPERVEVPVLLEKGTSAGGTVLNAEGQPVEGALVEVSAVTQTRNHVLLGEFTTDAQGRWSVQTAPADADRLILRVAHPGYVPTSSAGDPYQLYMVERGPNVEVRLVRGIPLAGRVVDQQGNAVAGAHLCMDNLYEVPPYALCADGDIDGRFRFEHCPARQITIIASAPGFAPNAAPVKAVPDMAEAVIALSPARPVRFVVVDPDQTPLANARAHVTASRNDSQFYKGGKGLKTDAQGVLTLPDAPRDALY